MAKLFTVIDFEGDNELVYASGLIEPEDLYTIDEVVVKLMHISVETEVEITILQLGYTDEETEVDGMDRDVNEKELSEIRKEFSELYDAGSLIVYDVISFKTAGVKEEVTLEAITTSIDE